ncbi:MAG: ethanolamine utilization protein EutJ [Chloroflexota bacterium]|nr:MAG: ethanolamine utilization protein EutJ [Chloroflexota bacterium]
MNPELDAFLTKAQEVMVGELNGATPKQAPKTHVGRQAEDHDPWDKPQRRVHVGVDLGTAYTVLAVLDEQMQPLAGEYRFAQIVRDGLVVDFHGAISLLRELKQNVEDRLGFELTTAATTYPPGVPATEVRATRYVVEAAGFEVEHMVDEPTAANAVLQVENGAVVDVGGGTTGIAIFRNGEVIYTADEPTGGTHFSLVIAGALKLEFEQAEALKKDTKQHRRLFPVVRPVMEKVGTIVARHIAVHPVETIYLVGGTASFSGIDRVIQEVTGVKTVIPGHPLFVTPLGVAMHDA